jgi:hypothetical protein
MVVNVSLVADAVIGAILVIRKIGSGYEIFVIGIITLPSVGAMVHITTNSSLTMARDVLVLFIMVLLFLFVLYLWVLLMVLLFLIIYVCVIHRSREREMKNRAIG